MKYIIDMKPKERINLNDLEIKMRNARNSCDYVLVNFGRKGEFIKVAFCKDQTYCIGYNFWNMEFAIKTNVMMKQYPKTVLTKLSAWLFDWVNKLNR